MCAQCLSASSPCNEKQTRGVYRGDFWSISKNQKVTCAERREIKWVSSLNSAVGLRKSCSPAGKKSFECGEKSGARSRNWVEPDLKTWCSSDGRDTEALIETLRLLKVTVFKMWKLRFDFIFRVSRHSKVVRFCKPRKRSICLFQYASYWFLISSLPHQVLEGTVRDLCLINQQTL